MEVFQLIDKESGDHVGEISGEQLQFLIDHLEEESVSDQDYFINRATLEVLEAANMHHELLDLLREALGERDEIELRWESA